MSIYKELIIEKLLNWLEPRKYLGFKPYRLKREHIFNVIEQKKIILVIYKYGKIKTRYLFYDESTYEYSLLCDLCRKLKCESCFDYCQLTVVGCMLNKLFVLEQEGAK